MRNKNQGFTILELLVVVGIIGILASLILVATGSARGKGKDAGIKSNLQAVRTQSALFFVENNNSYLPKTIPSAPYIGACPAYSATGSNMFSRDQKTAEALAEALSLKGGTGAGNRCANSAVSWAVAVRMHQSGTWSWCIDSAGKSKAVNNNPTASISSVPSGTPTTSTIYTCL